MLVVGLLAVPAFAAKGGGGSRGGDTGSSLVLVMTDPTDTTVNHGDVITFAVSTTATDKPDVNVRCTQDGALVYDAWAGFYPGAWFGQDFTLSSSYWSAGAADCTARIVYWARNGRERTVTTLPFHAEA
jgi:hypothetical protein